LRQQHITPQGKPGDPVFHAVLAAPLEDGWAEADGKALHHGPATAGGEEVPELVDENRPAEKQYNEKDDPKVGQRGLQEIDRHGGGYGTRVFRCNAATRRASASAATTAGRSAGSKF